MKMIGKKIKIPNKTTLSTMKKAQRNQGLVHCKDAQDLFIKLGI